MSASDVKSSESRDLSKLTTAIFLFIMGSILIGSCGINIRTGNTQASAALVGFLSLMLMPIIGGIARESNFKKKWRILVILSILFIAYIPMNVASLFIIGSDPSGEIIYCDGKRIAHVGGNIWYRSNFCKVQTVPRNIQTARRLIAHTNDGRVFKKCFTEKIRIPKSAFDFKIGLDYLSGKLKKEHWSQRTRAFRAVVANLSLKQVRELHDLQLARMIRVKLANTSRREGILYGEVFVSKKKRCSR